MHRRRDVLHVLRADIGELHRQLVGDLLVHRARDADAANLGETFQTGCDIDTIAHQIAAVHYDITEIDADPEPHPVRPR